MVQHDEPIRPGVWAAGLALALGAALASWLVLVPDPDRAAQDTSGAAGVEEGRLEAAGPETFESFGGADAGAPAPGLRPRVYGGGPGVAPDPQLAAMHRSLGGDAGLAPFTPRAWEGRLARFRGSEPVAEGERCDVRVLPVRTRMFNCLVRVTCGGVVLYPDGPQRAGYAPCDVADGVPTRAVDDGTTPQDGDPTLEADLLARRVRVTDEGPGRTFEAEVVLDARL